MRWIKLLIINILALALLMIVSCKITGKKGNDIKPSPIPPVINTEPQPSEEPSEDKSAETYEPTPAIVEPTRKPVDYSLVQPNEIGEIPIVMFHNFVEDLNETTDQEFTTSFEEFELLLETLYNEDYRLISMRDFIDHNIDIPPGKRPIVFTFDDGSAGQFNLIEENGKLVVNPKSAVGVMLKFHQRYPDFGLKGIFYLNMDLGEKTFAGAGNLKERLEILLSYGFEAGNHSWGHFNFETSTSKQQIYEKLGKNEKCFNEITNGLSFYSLALPFGGRAPEHLSDAMVSGQFEGVSFNNETIMAVGYLPSVPSIHVDYDPAYVRRIRAAGKIDIKFDLNYWLPLMTESRMYISDGDPGTIAVPAGKEDLVVTERLNGKKLVIY
jgi:peptidoglycan/xylan/chitin deacetylase (PgdA/CDA1 family)